MSQARFNEALTRDMSTQTAPAPQTTSIVDIENEEDERVYHASIDTYAHEIAKRQLMESQENLHLGGVPRLREGVTPRVRINGEGVSSEWTGTYTDLSEDDENFSENYGDGFVQELMDVAEEDEFSRKSVDRRQQAGNKPYTVISNTPKYHKPDTEFKGIIIEQHGIGRKTEKGLLTSIANHGGKRTPCPDGWKTGGVLGWNTEFTISSGIQRHSKDLRGRPKEEFREILRMILS